MTTHPTNTPAGQLSKNLGELKSADLDALEKTGFQPSPELRELLRKISPGPDYAPYRIQSAESAARDAKARTAAAEAREQALIAEVREARGLLNRLSSAAAKTINLAMSGRAARADIRDILAGPADSARAFLAKTDRRKGEG